MFPIKTTLAKHNIRLKKRLGQNLLRAEHALESIAAGAAAGAGSHILEIGAGPGNLSILLAKKAEKLYVLEKDPAFEPLLRETLKDCANTSVLMADILEFELKTIFTGKKLVAAGNLPFYITSPIIIRLIEQREYIDTILITVQKEVAQRITAKPGTKDYGRLTCLVQYYTAPELLRVFPKEMFFPQPEVSSALVRMKILDSPSVAVKSEKMFFNTVRAIFSHRRKTLLNSMLAGGGLGMNKEGLTRLLDELKLPRNIRGEQLRLEQIGRLSDAIHLSRPGGGKG